MVVRNIINPNNPFGKVAGCIPLFNIGGTVSNENVVNNKINEMKIIIKETLNELFKTKGKLSGSALRFFSTVFIL